MDISILRYLDVLIGLVVVMALASSFVTMITQFMLQWRYKRSACLQEGLAALLKRADQTLLQHADTIAAAVLQWHTVSGKPDDKREVIEREQLILILLEIAKSGALAEEAKNALFAALGCTGSDEEKRGAAGKLLQKIDSGVSDLEVENSKLATQFIRTQAIHKAIQGTEAGKLVNALMTRFDSMSERLTSLYTAHSRTWTIAASLAVAFILPLDSIDLLQRLSSDDKLRAELVTKAAEISAESSKPAAATKPAIPPPPGADAKPTEPKPPATGKTAADAGTQAQDAQKPISAEDIKKAYEALNDPKLSLSPAGWWPGIWEKGGVKIFQTFLGCLLSALLMSIGAPFWFDALKNLLKLRPSLAKADDEARDKRRKDETSGQAG